MEAQKGWALAGAAVLAITGAPWVCMVAHLRHKLLPLVRAEVEAPQVAQDLPSVPLVPRIPPARVVSHNKASVAYAQQARRPH